MYVCGTQQSINIHLANVPRLDAIGTQNVCTSVEQITDKLILAYYVTTLQ
jgi:hypothetical protein